MTITRIANAHLTNQRNARTSAPLLQTTSHLVLDNDTGRVVGMQHSLQLSGRTFSSNITPVL